MPSNQSQPLKPAASHNDPSGPGALRGQAWLTVQTRQAQQLIRGRSSTLEKPAIIGLLGFADRLRVIWQAARNDDPYADWWLIKVHEALDHTREFVCTEQAAINARLAQLTAIEVAVAESLRPYRVALQFANPYAYRGAQMIAEYDTLVRTLLTGCHVGLLDRECSEKLIHLGGRKIRGTFAIPQGYRFLGVDRQSICQNPENGTRPRQMMGDLPADVLSGERRAPLVPRKVPYPTDAARSVVLNPLTSPPCAPSSEDQNPDG